MQTIGKKREQIFIQIRKKKKREFFKQSRSKLIKSQQSNPINFISLIIPQNPHLKREVEEKCRRCMAHLLELKRLCDESESSNFSKNILPHYKFIKDFVNENNDFLEYSLSCLMKLNFFNTILEVIKDNYYFIFFKLFYSFELLLETKLFSYDKSK